VAKTLLLNIFSISIFLDAIELKNIESVLFNEYKLIKSS